MRLFTKAVLFTWIVCGYVRADVKPAPLFQDNMVLQQKIEIPVWGKAEPGEKVVVQFGKQIQETAAGSNGQWRVTLKPMKASNEARVLTIAGKNTITLANVVVGEVWVCSGQSNMAFLQKQAMNAAEEAARADYPGIRMFTVPRRPAAFPRDTCGGQWSVCTPDNVKEFSAVGYFFARNLHEELKVPVGMINTSWGGTLIEPWTPLEMLVSLPLASDRITEITNQAAVTAKNEVLLTENPKELERQMKEAEAILKQKKMDWTRERAAQDDGITNRWFDPGMDMQGWQTLSCPMPLRQNVLSNYFGFTWVKKQIEIPPTWTNRELVLRLGPIDDSDDTYVNGVRVGNTREDEYEGKTPWATRREYRVPASAVQAPKVTIAVSMMNTRGAVGMIGEAGDFSLAPQTPAEGEVPVSLAGTWLYKKGTALDRSTFPAAPVQKQQQMPANLYNGMIVPLIPFGIRGAIWYQGESNARRPDEYQLLLPAMIRSWRQAWGQKKDFPFGIVQLANYMQRQTAPIHTNSWADLREAQSMALSVPETGLAVIIDIGNASDIHPTNKQDVGKRLALWALAKTYGKKLVYSGPMYRSLKVKGNEVELSFDHIGGGLISKGPLLTGFAIAGEDKVFHFAQAEIKGKQIVVRSEKVEKPVAVRYAWANNPICNLFNKENLPAVPFRTDNWKPGEIKADPNETLPEVESGK